MFPDANIPVVQLSLRDDLDPEAHLAAGRAVAALRDEGVLIVASGLSFHNMRGHGYSRFTAPSEAFDDWLTAAVQAAPARPSAPPGRWAPAPQPPPGHHA